eukprot:13491950-Ditylum_brightwellii.AAC.2
MVVMQEKIVSEEPHGVTCGNAAAGIREEPLVCSNDWKQRSTQATQATLKSVRIKRNQQSLKKFSYQTWKYFKKEH